MNRRQLRVGAGALALVILLSGAAPAFAASEDREPRGPRERLIWLIAKIRNVIKIGATDDGLSIPKP